MSDGFTILDKLRRHIRADIERCKDDYFNILPIDNTSLNSLSNQRGYIMALMDIDEEISRLFARQQEKFDNDIEG